jgi:hypothetical protein
MLLIVLEFCSIKVFFIVQYLNEPIRFFFLESNVVLEQKSEESGNEDRKQKETGNEWVGIVY